MSLQLLFTWLIKSASLFWVVTQGRDYGVGLEEEGLCLSYALEYGQITSPRPHFPLLPKWVIPVRLLKTSTEIIHAESMEHTESTVLTLATTTAMLRRQRQTSRPVSYCC